MMRASSKRIPAFFPVIIVPVFVLLAVSARLGCASVAVFAADGAGTPAAAQSAALQPAAENPAEISLNHSDSIAEEQLFLLANRARREAGAPALTLDPGLSQAARTHARTMLEAGQLSHRVADEPSLPQRLAIATQLLLDQEAENIALDSDPQCGHEHLMHSPPHRANLLNPAYNVIGVGVVRSGNQLYIVQDFGHALPDYSETELKDRIALAVNQIRRGANQPELLRRDLLVADDAACSMAQADKVSTAPVRKLAQRFTVLTYTGMRPEVLPSGTAHTIASRNLRDFSVGACFARTDTYPLGVYWVVLTVE
jgi:uncharacterized protein YkwD